jgi:hypothetical protein
MGGSITGGAFSDNITCTLENSVTNLGNTIYGGEINGTIDHNVNPADNNGTTFDSEVSFVLSPAMLDSTPPSQQITLIERDKGSYLYEFLTNVLKLKSETPLQVGEEFNQTINCQISAAEFDNYTVAATNFSGTIPRRVMAGGGGSMGSITGGHFEDKLSREIIPNLITETSISSLVPFPSSGLPTPVPSSWEPIPALDSSSANTGPNRTGEIVGITAAVGILMLLSILAIVYRKCGGERIANLLRRSYQPQRDIELQASDSSEEVKSPKKETPADSQKDAGTAKAEKKVDKKMYTPIPETTPTSWENVAKAAPNRCKSPK